MSTEKSSGASAERSAEDWRTICRDLAEERALAESLEEWQWQERDDPVPFAYRWEHVQEVVRIALALAAAESATADETLVTEAAAWLHDVCKLVPEHADAGAEEARTVLTATDFPPHLVDDVVSAIAQHEGLTRPAGSPPLAPLPAALLWDADKLSKIGMGAFASNLAGPFASGRTLAERRQKAADFLHKTLVHTVASMNTPSGRAAGQRRYAAMVAAIAAWEEEAASPLGAI
jgi:HD superfamily phosphodiesterase